VLRTPVSTTPRTFFDVIRTSQAARERQSRGPEAGRARLPAPALPVLLRQERSDASHTAVVKAFRRQQQGPEPALPPIGSPERLDKRADDIVQVC
jgi:hypothetical protein